MASTQEYNNARAAVLGGSATQAQIDLVEREAQQAGSRGSQAREALKKAGK